MNGQYDNWEIVSGSRTTGRGLHGLNSDNRRKRKHTRRFLAWFVGRSEHPPAPIRIVNGYTLIRGVYKDGWNAKEAEEVIGLRGKTWLSKINPSIYREDDLVPLGITFDGVEFYVYGGLYKHEKFQRDGIPNNYDHEAEMYDEYCLLKNRKAYAVNHEEVIDWTKTYKDEILKIAKDYQKRKEAVREYLTLPIKYRERKERSDSYFYRLDYDYFCLLAVRDYHSGISDDVKRECHYSKNTSKQNARQLRALGFVA